MSVISICGNNRGLDVERGVIDSWYSSSILIEYEFVNEPTTGALLP